MLSQIQSFLFFNIKSTTYIKVNSADCTVQRNGFVVVQNIHTWYFFFKRAIFLFCIFNDWVARFLIVEKVGRIESRFHYKISLKNIAWRKVNGGDKTLSWLTGVAKLSSSKSTLAIVCVRGKRVVFLPLEKLVTNVGHLSASPVWRFHGTPAPLNQLKVRFAEIQSF